MYKTASLQPKESDICKQFVNVFKTLQFYKKFPPDMRVHHIPNECLSGPAYIRHLLAMGMTKGIADYLVEYDGNRHAWIEFKRNSTSKQTIAQKLFEEDCLNRRVPFLLTYDQEEALEFLRKL